MSIVPIEQDMNEHCTYTVGHERALYLYSRPWTSTVFILWMLGNAQK